MAMEFKSISKMSVGEVVQGTATEGGAVVAGLFGAGVVGKQIENMVKKDVVAASPMMDKLMAYTANNAPKLALYYLVRKEGGQYLKGFERDIGKGMLASIMLDTVVRAGNDFAPKSLFQLFGYDVLGTPTTGNATPQMQANMQKVLQENSSLRAQLNSALQRVASASPNVTVTPVRSAAQIPPPPPDHDRAYGMMQTTPEAEDRRKKFGAMTPPIEDERNRRFSAMDKPRMNFAGDVETVAQQFGML